MAESAAKKARDTKYESSPKQIKNREERNQARRVAEREGKVAKGDGLDIDHKKPLIDGGTNVASNQRVRTVAANRGWRKGKSDYNPA